MNLEQIETLITIVKEGSFRAAAESLNKSQSALSYAIKNLEEELDLKIFDRSKYRPELTQEGSALFDQAKQVLSEVQKFRELGGKLSEGVEAVLHLGISAPFPIENIIPCLGDFSKKMPSTRLKLSIEVLSTIERLRKGDVDIAVSEIGDTSAPDLEKKFLLSLNLIPVASSDHPLSIKNNELGASDLMNFPHIVLRSTFDSGEKSAGILSGASTWSVTDFQTKKRLLLGGAGWGTMPDHLVKQEIKQGKLRRLSTRAYQSVKLDFYLVRKKDKILGPAASYLWDRIQKECIR